MEREERRSEGEGGEKVWDEAGEGRGGEGFLYPYLDLLFPISRPGKDHKQ